MDNVDAVETLEKMDILTITASQSARDGGSQLLAIAQGARTPIHTGSTVAGTIQVIGTIPRDGQLPVLGNITVNGIPQAVSGYIVLFSN